MNKLGRWIAGCLLLSGVTVHAFQVPDATLTPGEKCTADDPNFDTYKYSPPVAICKRIDTQEMKLQISAGYGINQADWKNYEFDHLLPLCAGGSTGIQNIWPQPLAEAHEKDKIEDQVCAGLRNGTMTQDEAVQKIWDWFKARQEETGF